MILLIIQLAYLFFSTNYVYQTAKSKGQNVALWTIANIVAYLVIPSIINIVLGMALGFAIVTGAITPDSLYPYAAMSTFWTIWTIGIGVIGSLLIIRHVKYLSENADFVAPPEPGMFDLDN